MTQLPGTETQVPQEATAEEVGSRGFSGGGSWHAEGHPAHSREPSEYGKKRQFCTLKRWIQAAEEGKEMNANIRKLAGGKVNPCIRSNQLTW